MDDVTGQVESGGGRGLGVGLGGGADGPIAGRRAARASRKQPVAGRPDLPYWPLCGTVPPKLDHGGAARVHKPTVFGTFPVEKFCFSELRLRDCDLRG